VARGRSTGFRGSKSGQPMLNTIKMKTWIAATMMIGLLSCAVAITADTPPLDKAKEAPASGAAMPAQTSGTPRLAGDRDYYFVLRTDDKDGAGTISDPYNGTGYARFDRLMRSIPPDSVIHLSPGVYETEGGGFDQACQDYEPPKDNPAGHGFKLRPGWAIDGWQSKHHDHTTGADDRHAFRVGSRDHVQHGLDDEFPGGGVETRRDCDQEPYRRWKLSASTLRDTPVAGGSHKCRRIHKRQRLHCSQLRPRQPAHQEHGVSPDGRPSYAGVVRGGGAGGR
jgi:hypothetical protein